MGKLKLDLEEKGRSRWSALVIPVILVLFFLLAFVIRSYFYWPPAAEPVDTYGGEGYLLSGNDPNYHKRVADYIQETHTHLVFDPMLDFPRGSPNPNPPLYSWSIALIGYLISPALGGDVQKATWLSMEFAAAFWAALTVFPVYVFTRDMFGKKPGIFAAFFIAVMAGNVERTPVGFSDHDAFVVFFVVLSFLFLMRALRMLNNRKYVDDYFNARSLAKGVQELFKENRKAFLYAALAGLSITGVALAWKGVVYLYAIILVYYVFHLAIKKLRKEEGIGIALIILSALGLSLVLTFPYYSIRYFTGWFESPLFVFTAMAILALLLVPTRDIPWIIVVPMITVLIFGGMFTLKYLFPDIVDTILSLQGYFVKTKLYETIAEAQAPDFSRMVFSYGVITFYLTLLGAGWAAFRLPAEKWRNDYIMTVMWAIVAIYMALSAVRFMYNATPIFAIFGGWVTYELVKLSRFDLMMKAYRGMKSEPFYAIRKTVKARHVLTVLFVVFLIIWPNFWYGLDAGIPYEKKGEVDQKIYDTLPGFMKPDQNKYDSSGQWWLGSFGTAYPSDYWVDGMFWLAEQDSELLPEDKPAFISWWDYGHWAVHMGQHPAAADNFQNGFQWAGNYITAQNESIAIALVACKIIEGNMADDDEVLDILERYVGKENREAFVDYYYNSNDYKKEVLDNPHLYGPHDKNRMDPVNVKYLMMSRMLTTTLELEEIVDLLHELEVETGDSMRYFAVDSRLLPVGPQNTGIFYAPTKLSDQNINDFLVVWAIGNDGSRTNVNDAKAMEERFTDQDFEITKYEIEYTDMFFNSMFYKAYIGWSPIDLEINEMAIPTISRPTDVGRTSLEVQGMPPIQGWGMTHHRLEYRTVYWNPNKTAPQDHPDKWEVVTPEKVEEYKNMSESDIPEVADRSGILDTTYRGLYGGVFFLKYYDGAYINGTITLEDGTPLPGARVTVYDDLELANVGWPGAPHGFTYTDEDGRYSIIAPYGNVTVRVTNGGQEETGQMRTFQLFMQMEKRVLNESVIPVTDNQAMRVDEDRDGDGIWDYNIRHDVVVNYSKLEGRAFWDLDDDGVFSEDKDEPMAGLVGLLNSTYDWNLTTRMADNGTFVFEAVTPDDYDLVMLEAEDDQVPFLMAQLAVDDVSPATHDIAIRPAHLNGTVVDEMNETVPGVRLMLENRTGSITYSTRTDVNGTYMLDRILPGNYSLSIDDVRYMASKIRMDIPEGDESTMNVTLANTIKVGGAARLPDGSSATNAMLVFRNIGNDSLSVQVKVGPKGLVDGHVPPGDYSINGRVIKDDVTFAFMRAISIEEDTTLDFNFKRAYRINGTIYDDMNDNGKFDPVYATATGTTPAGSGAGEGGPTIPSGMATISEARTSTFVEFENEFGNISMSNNKAGQYEVYLSEGEYTVFVHTFLEDKNYTTVKTIKVSGPKQIDIPVEDGTKVEGSVFHDVNDNGVLDEGEALDGAKMALDDGENILVRYANGTGYYNLLIPSKNYDMTVSYDGYIQFDENIDIAGPNYHKNIILQPENITLNGITGFDKNGNGIIDPAEALKVKLKFVPEGWDRFDEEKTVEITTEEDGTFTLDIFPRNYTVEVDETITPVTGGPARYRYDDYLNLSIGQGEFEVQMSLDRYFKVTGDIFFDENGNGLLNTGERRSPALKFYTITGEEIGTEAVSDGYEVYLRSGTYSYYAHEADANSKTGHTAVLDQVKISEETELDIAMVEATRFNGVLFFDEDGDGELDTGEQERDVAISFTRMVNEKGKGTMEATSNDIGEYSLYVPTGFNYTIIVSMVDDRTLHNQEYTVKFTYEVKVVTEMDRKSTLVDLPIDMFYLVSGNVTYESPDGPVELEGARVKFDEFTTTSEANGSYELFVRPGEYDPEVLLPGFVLPESPFGNRTIEYDKVEQLFVLDPVKVTVEGYVYVDHDNDGARDPKTEGMMSYLEFISADVWSENVSITTDSRGKFVLDIEPGSYHLWISADAGLHHYAYFDHFGLKASGDVEVMEFPLDEAVTLQGEVYYEDTDGVRHTPTGTNITVEALQTGAIKEFTIGARQYAYHLPSGEYNISAEVTNQEYDMAMEYVLDTTVNLTERTKKDIVFEKDKRFHLKIEWDTAERVLLQQNDSVTYTIKVTNVGNEPGTFEIGTSPPGGWKAKTSKDEVSLAIGQSTQFTVLINVSEDAKAGENAIPIMSNYVLNDDFANSTSVYVDVVQVFNLSFEGSGNEPSYDHLEQVYTYYVNIKNDGNGIDNVKISTPSHFPGWVISFSEPEPKLSKGQTKEIEVTLQPEDIATMTGREMTVRLQATSESGKTVDYEVLVTFPDLKGTFEVSGPGVKAKEGTKEPFKIPSFEGVLVVAAIAVVAVYHRRMGRGKGGGGR